MLLNKALSSLINSNLIFTSTFKSSINKTLILNPYNYLKELKQTFRLFQYVKDRSNYRVYVDSENPDLIVNNNLTELKKLSIYPVQNNRVFRKSKWVNKIKKKQLWPYARRYFFRYRKSNPKPKWWPSNRVNKEKITELYVFFNSNNLSLHSLNNLFLLRIYLISVINLENEQQYGYYKFNANSNDEPTSLLIEHLFNLTFLSKQLKRRLKKLRKKKIPVKLRFAKKAVNKYLSSLRAVKKKRRYSKQPLKYYKKRDVKKIVYMSNAAYDYNKLRQARMKQTSFLFNFHEDLQ